MPALDPPPLSDPYSAWRYPDYRFYASSFFLLVFGKMIETVAVGVYLYDRTGKASSLGWVGLVQALPVLLLAIPGGQLADRFSRRKVLICTLIPGVFATVGLMFNAISSGPLWVMYLCLTISAIGQALGGPSRSAMMPQFLPALVLSNGITWNSSIFHFASMTGPAVGGLMIGGGHNIAPALLVVILCRILSIISVVFIQPHINAAERQDISLESVLAGIRFVWNTKLILATITLDLFAVLFGGLTYLLPVFATDILKVSHEAVGMTVGFLRSAEAVGAVAMAMLIAHRPPMRRAGWTMLWAVAGFGAVTIVFGLSTSFWLSLAMMLLIGAFDNVSVVVRHSLVQLLTPDSMRGRVSAVNNIFIVASNDIGGLESGLTADWFGPVISVVAGGVITLVVVPAAAWLWPELLALGPLHEVRPVEEEPAPVFADDETAQ
jgi:MFS family permease